MTAPMLFGTYMTFHWLLLYRLKPRAVRKWLGLAFMCIGATSFFRPGGYGDNHSMVVFGLIFTGFDLLFGRDLSTNDED
jgi:hypothetical protein